MKCFKRTIAFSIAVIMTVCMQSIPFATVKADDRIYGDEDHEIVIDIQHGIATSKESNVGWSFANNTLTIERGYTCSVFAFDEGVDITVDNHGVLYDVNEYITKIINESDGVCDNTVPCANIVNYGRMYECTLHQNDEKNAHLDNHGSISTCYVGIATTNYEGAFIDQDVWFYNGITVQGNAGTIRCGFSDDDYIPGMGERYIDVTTGSKIASPSIEDDEYVNMGWSDNHNYWDCDLGYINFDQLEIRVPHEFRANTRPKVWISYNGEYNIESDNLQRQCEGTVYPYEKRDKDVTWSLEGAEDPATTIDANGLLTVSPEETASKIKVRATSVKDPSMSSAETLQVRLPRIATEKVLPDANVNEPYSLKLKFAGDAENYTMSPVNCHLPEGLTIDPDGTLHGTITKLGTYQVILAGHVTYNAGSYNETQQTIGGVFTLNVVKADQTLDTSSFKDVTKYAFVKSFTQTVTVPEDGGTVTYSSSNDTVAKVNSTTGEVTLVGEGTAVITADAAETENYLPASASYTVTVEKTPTPTTSSGVLNGDQQTLNPKELPSDGMTVRLDMPMKDVVRVTLDNKELTLNQDFTMWSGSTFIQLTPEYLATLSEGQHTLAIFSDNDYKSSNFTLAQETVEPKKEDTGSKEVVTPATNQDTGKIDTKNPAAVETKVSEEAKNEVSTNDQAVTPKTPASVNTGDQTNSGLYAVILLIATIAIVSIKTLKKD